MVRIPSFIVVIASFVTLLQMIMQAYVPALYATLGLFIPLIVVNCIVLGRAEAFAAKNNPVASLFDGLGMGLGFTIALTLLGAVREFLGTGKIFNLSILLKNTACWYLSCSGCIHRIGLSHCFNQQYEEGLIMDD